MNIEIAILPSKTVQPTLIQTTIPPFSEAAIELNIPTRLNIQGALILIGLLETAVKTINGVKKEGHRE